MNDVFYLDVILDSIDIKVISYIKNFFNYDSYDGVFKFLIGQYFNLLPNYTKGLILHGATNAKD